MVILVCPGEESSLGSLVGTCLVTLRSLCVVAVRLLMLSLLVLDLFELVLGTSCLLPWRLVVCRELRFWPSGCQLAVDRGQCCSLMSVVVALQLQTCTLLIDGIALHASLVLSGQVLG